VLRGAAVFLPLWVATRAAEFFLLATCFAVASERARRAAAEGAVDLALPLGFFAAFAARVLAASARAAAAFFALTSAECLDGFVLAVAICFACFTLDDFAVFFADAITSALLLFLPRCGDGADPHGGHGLRRSKNLHLCPQNGQTGCLKR
jgi:hypothetical protein